MTKKIIIVGGTSGMGKRIAELYAGKNYKIGIIGRRKELLEKFQRQFPEQIETACFDVTGTQNIEQLELLVEKLGGLDILIISAGGGDVSEELSWETDKWIVNTNVNGFVQIANWAFNFFVKQNHGQLATISSIAAIRGNSLAPAYSAAKAFQSVYFDGLSMKAKKMGKNVFITCIEPGFVASKETNNKKLFWIVPVDKAARQIISAIEKKKKKAYISKRWWLIAKFLKWAPDWVIYKIG
jgi:short-subunit dehydrogenase